MFFLIKEGTAQPEVITQWYSPDKKRSAPVKDLPGFRPSGATVQPVLSLYDSVKLLVLLRGADTLFSSSPPNQGGLSGTQARF